MSNNKKFQLSIFISLICYFSIVDLCGAQPKPKANPQEYQNKITELKNRRDADIAGLIKQRDTQLRALQTQMKQMIEGEISQIEKNKNFIQLKMSQGQNMQGAQRALMQQDQALKQKTSAVQQQINTIKLAYDQQIQKVVQEYSQLFANLQQRMTSQGR